MSGLADEGDAPRDDDLAEEAQRDEGTIDDTSPAEAPSQESTADETPPGTPSLDDIASPAEAPSHESTADETPPGTPSLDDIARQIQAIPIGDFLVSTVMTLTSIAYGKLGAKELDQARGAIDAIGALVPVLEGRIEPQMKRDFEQALANLRIAYADASAQASP